MKTLSFIVLLLISFGVFGDEPNKTFAVKNNVRDSVVLTWKHSKNVKQMCQEESLKRNLGGFKIDVEACSFNDTYSDHVECVVVTKDNATMLDLAHEVRHCFNEHWHK